MLQGVFALRPDRSLIRALNSLSYAGLTLFYLCDFSKYNFKMAG